MIARAALIAAALMPLAACSLNDENDNGAVTIAANSQDGNVSVDLPGVSIKTKLPPAMLAKGDFDIDGVKLFPGSKIETMGVNAAKKASEKTVVDITFAAPAGVEAVRKHFVDGFAQRGIAVKTYDGSLTGKTGDGDDFAIDFVPVRANDTMGHVTVTSAD